MMTEAELAAAFIDREAEQELFQTLIQLKDEARILLISDKGDRGKSSLLLRLEYICNFLLEVAVPVTRVQLDQVKNADPYEFIKQIRHKLSRLEFKEFDRLSDALLRKDVTTILGTGSVDGIVHAAHANLQAGAIAAGGIGTLINVAATGATVIAAPQTWDAGLEERAREKCVDAFIAELREICATQLVVIILDSFDQKANQNLISWVTDRFLRGLTLDAASRAEKLVFVLAGRNTPPFAGSPRYKNVLRTIHALGLWEEKHVRAFLELHGYKVTDSDIKYLHNKLGEGLGFLKALQWAELVSQ